MTREELLKNLLSAIPADYDWEKDQHTSREDALLWWWCSLNGDSIMELNARERAELYKYGLPAETVDSMLDSIQEQMEDDIGMSDALDTEESRIEWLDNFYFGYITEFFDNGGEL